jgi:uncharacterized protein (DUF1015 family)
MLEIAPFQGLLYDPEKVPDLSQVVAPPYDVITSEEQERLYDKSAYNVVRLILNRDPDRYQSAARFFETWQSEGILKRIGRPALFFLKHRFCLGGEERERRGFIALSRIEDFSSGNIRPHERTLEAPKEDQLRLMAACRANLSPIFCLYADPHQAVDRLLAEQIASFPPLAQVMAGKEEACLLWPVTDVGVVREIRRLMESQELLIADGHHRYEAALNYRNLMRAERPQCTGREAFNYVMTYFANMHDPGLVILPTHRVLRALPGMPPQKLDPLLRRYFYVEAYPKTAEGRAWFLSALKRGGKRQRVIGASFKGDRRLLILRLKNKRALHRLAKPMSPRLRELDVTILHVLLLEHVLGIPPRQQADGDHVLYIIGEQAALAATDEDGGQATFLLNPVSPDEILAVARGGEKMPQKSTYFYPKPLTGLVINKLDDDRGGVDDGP